MKYIPFEHVEPHHIKVGDIVMCYAHDDQLESRAARVISIELDDVPGVFTWSGGFSCSYTYRLWLTCRHIGLKHLDAEGGPAYRWHRFPWNKVARYLFHDRDHQPSSVS